MRSNHLIRDIVICGLLGAAAAGVTMLELPFLPVVASIIILYLAGSLGGLYGAVMSLFGFAAVMYPVFGQYAIPEIAFAAVVSFGAVLVVKYAKRAFYALCGACGVALAAMWVNVLVGSLMLGPQVIEALFVADEAVLEALRQSYGVLGFAESEIATLVGEFSAAYGEMTPGILLSFSMVSGMIAYGVSTYAAKARLKFKAPPFEMWYMPKGHLMGAIVLLLVGYLMEYAGSPMGAPVTLAIELFIIVTYSVQGAAVVWFILKRTKLPKAAKIIIFPAVLIVMFGFGLLLLAVMDNVMLLRKRMPPTKI